MRSASAFPLTRYFVATGVITAVVVAAGLGLVTAEEVRADLIRQREELARMIAANLNQQIHRRFLVPTVARDGFVDLDRPDHLRALDELVRDSVGELAVESVYIFDMDHRIVYSTNLEHRGFRVQNNHLYDRARAGTLASAVVSRGDPLDVDGRVENVHLLETYVPAQGLDADGKPTGVQTGVIEIYQDATRLLQGVREAITRVVAYSTLAILSLMLALWLWVRKADTTIDVQTRELLEANQRLEVLSQDLERQVADRTRALLQAETLATVGTLSAGVAHEVNNPIAAIASSAEGLLRRVGQSGSLQEHPDFTDFPEYLEIIRDEAFRVKTITRNLLDFSRSSQPEGWGTVELRGLVEATARLVAHQVRQAGKRLELALGDEPVEVQGDAASLRQLALNLTVNALEATPTGGTVRWSLERDDEGVQLCCEDEGPGFGAEELEHALDPFYTRRPTGQGTGLGLWICYRVAQQHGGAIQLMNREQGGGRVCLLLRARAPQEVPHAQA